MRNRLLLILVPAILIFGVPAVVSDISRFVMLLPGDITYTGTPGATAAMKPGDVVGVEVEGVGILANPIAPQL